MAAEETATVQVAEGALRGRREASAAGGAFWSFKGVPYARPPVGPLRFKDAQEMEPWEGVRDAFKEGDNCRQFNFITKEYAGSEDCLFVNVYTPRLPQEGGDLLPVMVYIHGGGFEMGSGDSAIYSPDYLLSEGVIVVTINYRLGVLGFLFLGSEAPGNAGLKDQVAALRWVQKNIEAFGGDAGNVTLFGESAGGASVHFQMMSPMSKGLFHRGIAMSGAALNPWGVQTEPEQTARRLARQLGCTSDDDDAIVRFLRGVDYIELVRAARSDSVTPQQDKGRFLKFSFVTTPERVVPGVETFLPAPAEHLMKEGRYHNIPYMTGVTEVEAYALVGFVDLRDEDFAREADSKWEANVLPELRLPTDGKKNGLALQALRDFFMNGKALSKDTMRAYIDMFSDITFSEGVWYALKSVVKSNTAPVHQYFFTADDKLNGNKQFFKLDEPGATHGDDLGYLFHTGMVDQNVAPDTSAALTRKRFVRLLTNYAKTGDPTPTDDPLLGVRWKPYTDKERNYLDIGNQLQTSTNLLAERVAFWEKFYSTYAS